jgi:plasmid stabilization system protein ParE
MIVSISAEAERDLEAIGDVIAKDNEKSRQFHSVIARKMSRAC